MQWWLLEALAFWVQASNIYVSSKIWNVLSSSIIPNNLRHPPITDCIPIPDGFCCPVPLPPCRPWAAVTPIPGLSQVSSTGGVRSPGTILGTDGVNISPSDTVKLAPGVEEPLCTVAGYAGACSGYLLFHTRVVLYAPGDVSPGPIILELYIILCWDLLHGRTKICQPRAVSGGYNEHSNVIKSPQCKSLYNLFDQLPSHIQTKHMIWMYFDW